MPSENAQHGGEVKRIEGDDRLTTNKGNHDVTGGVAHYERFLSDSDGEASVGVSRHGDRVSLSMAFEQDDVRHGGLGCFTPEQAREIAAALESMANVAEDPPKREVPDTSFVGRLLG